MHLLVLLVLLVVQLGSQKAHHKSDGELLLLLGNFVAPHQPWVPVPVGRHQGNPVAPHHRVQVLLGKHQGTPQEHTHPAAAAPVAPSALHAPLPAPSNPLAALLLVLPSAALRSGGLCRTS